jgi:hypothetical protein
MVVLRFGVALAAMGLGTLSPASGALVTYDFNDGSGTIKKTAATSSDTNLTASPFSVNGGGDISATTDMAFIRSDSTDGTSLAGSITAGDYFQFTLTPKTNVSLDFTTLTFDYGGTTDSTAGGLNANFAIFSSLKTYDAANVIQSFQTTIAPSQGTFATNDVAGTVDLSAAEFQDITSAITFRIYVWDTQSGANLIDRFDNVVVNGISAVPEPSSVALLLVGPLALALRRRRSTR